MKLFICLVIGIGVIYIAVRWRQGIRHINRPAPPLPQTFYISRMWLVLSFAIWPIFFLMLLFEIRNPSDWADIAFIGLLNCIFFLLTIRILFFPAFRVTEAGIKPLWLPLIVWNSIESFEEIHRAKCTWDLGVHLKHPGDYYLQLRWWQKLKWWQNRFVTFQNSLLGTPPCGDVIRLSLYTHTVPPLELIEWMREYLRNYVSKIS